MDANLSIYSNKTILFKALNYTLMIFYILLFLGSILRPNFSIVESYKKQVFLILLCIIGCSTSNYYTVRILLFLSASWKINTSYRWFICDIGDLFYLFITFIITDISISFYCYYKLKLLYRKKYFILRTTRIFYIIISLGYIAIAIIDLKAFNSSIYSSSTDVCSIFIWFCIIFTIIISSVLIIRGARLTFTEEIVNKIKKNALILGWLFALANGIFYVIDLIFANVTNDNEKSALYFIYYLCDEIIPFMIMLRYLYRLKNDFVTNLEDAANELFTDDDDDDGKNIMIL
ncbi:hypothetical protein SteCoe_6571 [Stentor coeruleus]|uniref:Uncharacterized protein n=1 Tax=Stentor coeruleus TaxID=5963 RepID=A0A1R2BNH2_9CILI|nr:hypothetical protein SteCoe_21975 [Stentor coeruleus]OMJ90997.1 hypothetical protein SteCoe_6571 [Stentor coeruleus]